MSCVSVGALGTCLSLLRPHHVEFFTTRGSFSRLWPGALFPMSSWILVVYPWTAALVLSSSSFGFSLQGSPHPIKSLHLPLRSASSFLEPSNPMFSCYICKSALWSSSRPPHQRFQPLQSSIVPLLHSAFLLHNIWHTMSLSCFHSWSGPSGSHPDQTYSSLPPPAPPPAPPPSLLFLSSWPSKLAQTTNDADAAPKSIPLLFVQSQPAGLQLELSMH